MNEKFNWKRLLITLGIVIVAAGAVGGATWYVMDAQNKKEKAEADRQIAALDKLTKESKTTTSSTTTAKPADETASWKTYASAKYGFTIKYPTDWSYVENAPTASGNQYWGGNVFSANNVIFKNDADQVGVGLNMEEILGRGGICAKRTVLYTGSVASKKLSITKSSDTTQATASPDNVMCQGPQTGYVAGVEQFTQGGIQYFFHSESAGVSDAIAARTITTFEKMMGTMTFK